MHFISCHHVHRICIRVHFMNPCIFPVVLFAIRRSYVPRRPLLHFLRERVLNILRMDRGLTCGLGLLPVDRLSSFVPFGLRLILQRLTGQPQKPLLCAAQHPLKSGPKPIQNPSILSAVRSRSRGRKPHSIWTLPPLSTYKYVHPSSKFEVQTIASFYLAPPDKIPPRRAMSNRRRPPRSAQSA